MKTFEVSLWVEKGYSVIVQANSADEAEEKALETYDTDGRQVHGDSGICQSEELSPPRTKIPALNDEGKFVIHEGEAS